jgi:hypothetical protein
VRISNNLRTQYVLFTYVCTDKRNDRRGDAARCVEVEGDADIN